MLRKKNTASRTTLLRLLPVCGAVLLCALLFGSGIARADCVGGAPNGSLEAGEECDDNNTVNGDGCTFDCIIEPNCVDDVTGRTNVCTANDVNIGLVLNKVDVVCELGTTVDLELTAVLQATSAERWDIGLFIALDGGTARTGSCYHDYLRPPLAAGGTCSVTGEACNNPLTDPGLDGCLAQGTCDDGATACNVDFECPPPAGGGTCFVTGGSCASDAECAGLGNLCIGICSGGQTCDGGYCPCDGSSPFYNGEDDVDPADTCGDLEQGVDTYYSFVDQFGAPLTLTVPCLDNDGDGLVDIGSCVSWDNSRSDGSANKPSCVDETDAVPNTKSKCKCETMNIGNVFAAATIVVDKVTLDVFGNPLPGDPTLFDFTIDGPDAELPKNFQLADADPPHEESGLDPSFLSDETYSVTETDAGPGWMTTVSCENDGGVAEDPDAIDLDSGETVTCTFTNQLVVDEPDISAGVKKDNDADDDTVFTDTETVPASAVYPVTVPYQFTITNSSDSAATIPVGGISDDTHQAELEATMLCTHEDLTTFGYGDLPEPIGATEKITCTFEVVFDNADQGSVTNIISVTVTNDAGTSEGSDDSTVIFGPNPAISLVKSLASYDDNDGSGDISAGDGLWYQYDVTNTGNVTLDPVSVVDNTYPEVNPLTCVPTALAPTESAVCTAAAAHIITLAEANAGNVHNVATATGQPPVGEPVTDEDELDTPVVQHPAISLLKSLASYDDNDGSGDISAGDGLWYQYDVTNTGDVTLDPVSVVDNTYPEVNPVTCVPTALAPTEPAVCTAAAAHIITLAEANAGNVHNVATATGQPPVGEPVTDEDELDTPVVQHPAISLLKSLASYDDNDGSGDISAGDGLWYQYDVTNTGDVTLDPVSVVDNTYPEVNPVTCVPTALAPTEPAVCTAAAAHIITLAEANAGNVHNVATATGQPPVGEPVTDEDELDTPVVQHPAISLLKSLASYDDNDGSGDISAGDGLWYQYDVTNTGDVTLDPVSVVDNTYPEVNPVTCVPTALAPTEPAVCTAAAAHIITLAEANAGNVHNVATATGQPPVGEPVTDEDELDTPVVQHPAISLVKSLASYDDNDGSGDISAGDGLWYQYDVTNTGDVTLDPVSVVDNTYPEVNPVTCVPTALAPTEPAVCTAAAAHIITLAEANAGNVHNVATATGQPPVGEPVTDEDELDTPVVQHPAISLVKSLASYDDNDGSGDISAGDGLWYQYDVTNTGDVTLDPVSVVDNTYPEVNPLTCVPTALAPTEPAVCTAAAAHIITLAEANAGNVHNVATATGQPPVGEPVTDEDELDTPVVQHPAISLVKSLASYDDNDGSGDISAGDGLWYQYDVTNTGDVTLDPVSVVDNTYPEVNPLTCVPTALAPTEPAVCTAAAAHIITLAEANAGNVHNVATATGQPPVGEPVTDEDELDTPVVQHPAISLVKSLASYDDNDGSGDISAGDGLWYQYDVTNTGDVTLDPVSVVDNTYPEVNPLTCVPTALAPTESAVCTATAAHIITLAEANAGNVHNVATATGQPPVGEPVTDEDELDTPVVQHPAISLVKSLASYDDNDGSGDISAGDGLWYQYDVTNTGDVTLDPVSVVDNTYPEVNPLTCVPTALAPTEPAVCTAAAAHIITLAEANAGNVHNVATATGQPPVGEPVTDEDELDTPVVQHPAISLVKSLASYDDNDGSGDISAGDGLWYQYDVTNTGDVTLDPVSVVDNTYPEVNPLTCVPTALAPTEPAVCTAAAAHIITLAEANAGNVHNVATATGQPPVGEPVTDEDELDTPVVQHPAISLVKSLASYDDNDGSGDISAGDGLWYQYDVTNTGDVTLDPVSVVDNTYPEVNPLTCVPTALAPTEPAVCTAAAAHIITLAEANAGNVHNVATATGQPPVGEPVTDEDELDTPVVQHPAISLVKSLASYDDNDGSGDISAGDGLWYQYDVTNTGDVTLDPVSVVDNTYPEVNPLTCVPTALAPTEPAVCTAAAAHIITLAEANAGNVHNVATATGQPPVGEPVTDEDELDTPVVQHPAISLVKSLASYDDNDGSGDISAGDGLWYQYDVTNTGDVTLDPVSVVDNTYPEVNPLTCVPTALAPTESAVCTATAAHIITLAEANAGNVHNVATATGQPPVGEPVTDEDELDTPVVQHPAIDIEKHTNGVDADTPTGPTIPDNEPVTWSYIVTNTGDVTLFDILVVDNQNVAVNCPDGNPILMLAPLESLTCTGNGTAQMGQYANLGTATGNGPQGQQVADQDPSHYLGITCDLTVDKTCVVPQPPLTDFTCKKPIDCLTMIWDGTATIRVKAWKGSVGSTVVADIDDIVPGQTVEICGFAGSPNDVYWEIFEAGTNNLLGESKFHLSCSDDDMDGAEDCGNDAGNGKDDGGDLINDWIFDGMVGADGALVCTTVDPIPSGSCEVPSPNETLCEQRPKTLSLRYDGGDCSQSDNTQDPSKVHCDDDPATGDACEAGEPTALVFEYLGGDCSVITNDQDGRVECIDLGTPTGSVSVVMTRDADKIDVTPTSGLDVGDNVEIARNDGNRFASETEFNIVDDATGAVVQTLKIHTSCSRPLNVGDIFGPVKLVEYTAEDGTVITLPPVDPISTCETVNVVAFHDDDFYRDLTEDPINIGDIFTIDAATVGRNDLDSEITFQIIDADTGEMCQEVTFHTSCSQDLRLGDQFGSLEVVGFTNSEQGTVQYGTPVNYFYTVTNTGTVAAFDVVVVDDQGLDVMCPFDSLAVDQSMTCVASALILEETINVGTASAFVPGDLGPGATCEASDSATVTIIPPPPCSIQGQDELKLDKKKLEWKLTNTGIELATLDSLTVTWPSANGNLLKVTFDGDVIWQGSIPPTSATLTSADWINDLEKRQIPPGDIDTLKLEFESNVDKTESNYAITVNFAEACSVSFDPVEGTDFECVKPIDCLTMIWQGPANPQGANACDVGDPTALVFEYNGGDCSVITNTQGGKAKCTDYASPTGPVSVIMTEHQNDIAVTPASVDVGGWVTLARIDGGKLSSTTKFIIVDAVSGTVLQSLEIHTSCSQPLSVGDQFGPVTLVEYIAENGTVVAGTSTEPVSNIRVKAWKGSVGSTLLADTDNLMPGDELTVCGYAGSPNDVTWEIFEAGTEIKLGESMFHLSCSDNAMNGHEDCGTAQGDGKSNDSSLINGWLLEGIVAAYGTLDCSGGSSGTIPFVHTSGGDDQPQVVEPAKPASKPTRQPEASNPSPAGGRKRSAGRR